MLVKRNLLRRPATKEEIDSLQYPKDKFELISVDYTDEWDLKKQATGVYAKKKKSYVTHKKAVHITVKCKKCGTVLSERTDRPDMRCFVGPCADKWIDLTGRRFGKLVVEELALDKMQKKEGQRQRIWYWKCRCDCGNITYKTQHDLVFQECCQCRVCGRKLAAEKTKLPGDASKWHRMIRYYKKNASVTGREFSLTDEEFKRLAQSDCAYCGAKPAMTGYNIICNGVDRIDSSRGYVTGNVVPCCTRCNIMKKNMSVDEFLGHIEKIYNFRCACLRLNDHPEKEYTASAVETGVGPKG